MLYATTQMSYIVTFDHNVLSKPVVQISEAYFSTKPLTSSVWFLPTQDVWASTLLKLQLQIVQSVAWHSQESAVEV